jgi:hypothetical protein
VKNVYTERKLRHKLFSSDDQTFAKYFTSFFFIEIGHVKDLTTNFPLY